MKNIIMTFVLCILSVACKKDPGVNLGEDIQPGAGVFRVDAMTLNSMLGNANSLEERTAKLEQNAPHLAESLVYFLSMTDRIPKNNVVERIEYYFGSLENIQGRQDSHHELVRGHFENQLIARVYPWNSDNHVDVIVSNFTIAVIPKGRVGELEKLGMSYPQTRFKIGAGQGLVKSHVDFRVAMDLADRFNLPLFRGPIPDPSRRISVAEATRLERESDRTQITVYVKEGDMFDLRTKEYFPVAEKVAQSTPTAPVRKWAPKKPSKMNKKNTHRNSNRFARK